MSRDAARVVWLPVGTIQDGHHVFLSVARRGPVTYPFSLTFPHNTPLGMLCRNRIGSLPARKETQHLGSASSKSAAD
eukprot:366450-Chlamydomonas_euryale.AAC.40